jgi:hypothetical protein
MALAISYLDALDAACAKAKEGARNITTHNDGEVELGINELGGVEIKLSGDAKSKTNFEDWCAAGMKRSASGAVACTTPVFGAWDIGFRAE